MATFSIAKRAASYEGNLSSMLLIKIGVSEVFSPTFCSSFNSFLGNRKGMEI